MADQTAMTSERKVRVAARWALARGDQRTALSRLLEADDRFAPNRWVLARLARLHHELGLAQRGIGYADRCLAIRGNDRVARLRRQLEGDLEREYRSRARIAHTHGNAAEAVDFGMTAASVTEPETWTLRVLIDAAIDADRRADAVPVVTRARSLRPNDHKLVELEQKLHG